MVCFGKEVNWKKILLLNRLFRMQLSLTKIHFIYSEGHPGQTEKRLHNKFTLGAGGHMNPGGSMEPMSNI